MVSRVATFSRNEQMLSATLRTQARLAELQMQESTGLVATDYGGLGAGAKRTIDLQVSVARAKSYVDTTNLAKGRVELMHSALSTLADLLTNLRSQITAASGATTGTGENLKAGAQELLKDFASVLNTRYEGRYLFAGGRTDTEPVDISNASYPPATSPSTPSTSYYQGDGQIASVRVSDTQVVAYGVTADDPAFEQALRSLSLVANIPTDPLDSATLDEANDLLVHALDSVLAVQSRLSLDAGSMEDAVASQEDYVAFATSLVSDLTEVDVAEVAARLSSYQAQLEASYASLAKIQSLNLWEYLR
jgi:flagellar hook-associated protein 3 FlgL